MVFDNDFSWYLLDEASKLASNTASVSYVVAPDGPLDMHGVETLPRTLAVLVCGEDQDDVAFADVGYLMLQASLLKTLSSGPRRVSGSPSYRVSGAGSSKKKTQHRSRKEVTQVEPRQFKHQFLEAKVSKDQIVGG